jgi:hypothetical protein
LRADISSIMQVKTIYKWEAVSKHSSCNQSYLNDSKK